MLVWILIILIFQLISFWILAANNDEKINEIRKMLSVIIPNNQKLDYINYNLQKLNRKK